MLGIEAPKEIPVHRQEVHDANKLKNAANVGLHTSEPRV